MTVCDWQRHISPHFYIYIIESRGGGVLNFKLDTNVRPEVSTTTL